jgi:hypothetical protein
VDSSIVASGILRSKDLRSVVETKRRNFSRSRSSSDSEDNGSSVDMTRPTHRKHQNRSPTRPTSFQEPTESSTSKTINQIISSFSFPLSSSRWHQSTTANHFEW